MIFQLRNEKIGKSAGIVFGHALLHEMSRISPYNSGVLYTHTRLVGPQCVGQWDVWRFSWMSLNVCPQKRGYWLWVVHGYWMTSWYDSWGNYIDLVFDWWRNFRVFHFGDYIEIGTEIWKANLLFFLFHAVEPTIGKAVCWLPERGWSKANILFHLDWIGLSLGFGGFWCFDSREAAVWFYSGFWNFCFWGEYTATCSVTTRGFLCVGWVWTWYGIGTIILTVCYV